MQVRAAILTQPGFGLSGLRQAAPTSTCLPLPDVTVIGNHTRRGLLPTFESRTPNETERFQ